MAEETINTQTPAPEVPTSRAEERITELSEKVRLTSLERDELKTLNTSVTKERDAFASLVDVVATNPAAKDHKDAILEKVKLGLTPEDATYAVLGKAGLLGGAPQPVTQQTVAGGSAPTTIMQQAEKPVSEMTQAERREQLSREIVWQ